MNTRQHLDYEYLAAATQLETTHIIQIILISTKYYFYWCFFSACFKRFHNFGIFTRPIRVYKLKVCLSVCPSVITPTFPLKTLLNHSGRMLHLIYFILLARRQCQVVAWSPGGHKVVTRWFQVVPCGAKTGGSK